MKQLQQSMDACVYDWSVLGMILFVFNDYSPLVLGRMLLPQTIQVKFTEEKLLPDSKQVTGSSYVCTEILLSGLNVEIRHNKI